MNVSTTLLSSAAVAAMVAATPALAGDDGHLYVGAIAGQVFYDSSADFDGSLWNSESGDFTTFGGLVGWRHDLGDGNFAAIEGDVTFADLSLPDYYAYWSDFGTAGHLRGLLGTTVHDNVSIFGALGLTAAQASYYGDDKTLFGFTVGAGAEIAVHDNMRLRIEGLYDVYGDVGIEDDTYNGSWKNATVRAAAIFDFN